MKEKKSMRIFFLTAYGIPYLMGILMWMGYKKGLDLSVFPNFQMLMPALGVILAIRLVFRERLNVFFTMYLIQCALLAGVTLYSLKNPLYAVTAWSVLLMIFAVLEIGMLFYMRKVDPQRLKVYGLDFPNKGKTAGFVLLFIFLFTMRTVIAFWIDGNLKALGTIIRQPIFPITLFLLPLSCILAFPAFFGEEYGWRFFLQPILQKKFGMRKGVLLLGVLWGIWHLPLNILFYNQPRYALLSIIGQQITCITMGIFFAYVYQKTKNIWSVVMIHFFNNNLAVLFSGGMNASALQNQVLTWPMLFYALVLGMLFFGIFIFSKSFQDSQRRKTLFERLEEKKNDSGNTAV